MKHVLVTGRVCGWDEDISLIFDVDDQQPNWRRKILNEFRQRVWELDGNNDAPGDDDVFVTAIFVSNAPIIPWDEYSIGDVEP